MWTPEPGRAGRPVVVWISGGGYLSCDSADPYLTGAAVAAAGAVLVSPHYPTGFEGFAHLDGAPDNRALLDQLAALSWVQDNIAQFGGDPGTFRRAILQSIPGPYLTIDLAAEVAGEICGSLGRASTPGALWPTRPPRSLPWSTATSFRRHRGLPSPLVQPEGSSCWSVTAATSAACSPPSFRTSTTPGWTS